MYKTDYLIFFFPLVSMILIFLLQSKPYVGLCRNVKVNEMQFSGFKVTLSVEGSEVNLSTW